MKNFFRNLIFVLIYIIMMYVGGGCLGMVEDRVQGVYGSDPGLIYFLSGILGLLVVAWRRAQHELGLWVILAAASLGLLFASWLASNAEVVSPGDVEWAQIDTFPAAVAMNLRWFAGGLLLGLLFRFIGWWRRHYPA